MEELTRKQKQELINTLHKKVTEWDADGECCYYVYVPLDTETREVLNKLGYEDEEINSYAEEETNIDLTIFGFDFSNWWYSDSGFSDVMP